MTARWKAITPVVQFTSGGLRRPAVAGRKGPMPKGGQGSAETALEGFGLI
jgi:hypothetical protein